VACRQGSTPATCPPRHPTSTPYARARIGILANDANDCATPDSFIGIGAAIGPGNPCVTTGTSGVTAGNVAPGSCSADNGAKNVASFAYVFVR
jgi:hypothetical protein